MGLVRPTPEPAEPFVRLLKLYATGLVRLLLRHGTQPRLLLLGRLARALVEGPELHGRALPRRRQRALRQLELGLEWEGMRAYGGVFACVLLRVYVAGAGTPAIGKGEAGDRSGAKRCV